ncbi:helix-turn-helix domain-containing protein [Microbacterium trichothecenolyticum]|nr:helix-turn-helix transcriptional regulator [Microbacterium trichothecenolyticum]
MDTTTAPQPAPTLTCPTRESAPTDSTPARIESARLKVDRTKKWVAEQAGIAVSTFLRKLAGHGDFTISELARIARALGVHPSTLLPSEFAVTATVDRIAA